MTVAESLRVREATDDDIGAIRDLFTDVYHGEYPYRGFFDLAWLRRSIFRDDILTLVAEDTDTSRVLGTASVLFDVGAYSDLIGEFGRLAVHAEARGRGIAKALMEARIEFSAPRLHVGIVENRTVHPFSQRVSMAHDFAAVGFLPQKMRFTRRESVALWARHFGDALSLRNNHPRIVPEAHALATIALENCGLAPDAIVDEDAAPYPYESGFEIEELTAQGLPALLRIERGRTRHRELFGAMRLQYGFFKLTAKHATYLLAREPMAGDRIGPIIGAVGFIRDDRERSVKVFELISRSDSAPRFVLRCLLDRCRSWGIEYIETDVSAHAPRMQRTLIELGFLPVAYVPAMVFQDVERLDVIKMVRLLVPLDVGELGLVDQTRAISTEVLRAFKRQAILPEIEKALDVLGLFDGLTAEQSARVASACGIQELDPGARLFAAGDPADRMYVVIGGAIRIDSATTARPLGTVGPGESVGELAVLTGEPHSATAVAEDAVRTAVLDQAELRRLVRQRPDIAVVLYRNLAVGLGRKLQRLDLEVAGG